MGCRAGGRINEGIVRRNDTQSTTGTGGGRCSALQTQKHSESLRAACTGVCTIIKLGVAIETPTNKLLGERALERSIVMEHGILMQVCYCNS